ncbi:MAG TPA: hypothetical protein VFH08_07425 [Chitinophagaceae bacterium]|nr:hypothetical protein [Chitinophagaceae bacterium]
MKTISFKNKLLAAAALLLALPTAYFILIGVLSELGINGPLEATRPIAEKWGIKDPPGGFNISSLILFGPMLAILLTIFQFLKIEWHFAKEGSFVHFTFQKRWFPILITAGSIMLLAFLFFYMLGENCNC